jgi:hypothetical protein
MLTCRQLTELGTGYTEGALDPATARRVEAHLAGCRGCRTFIEQLVSTARALGSLPGPEVTPEARAAARRQFDAWRSAGAPVAVGAGAATAPGRRAALAVLAVTGLGALLVLAARRPAPPPVDWAVAGALALAAMALAALVRRISVRFALAAVSASLAAALIRGRAGAWNLAEGLECLATELGVATGLAAIAWLAARRRADPAALGGWAVAGALAGDAALHLICEAHGALAHLALFHAGGVLLVALLAGWAVRRARAAPVAA